MHIVNHKRIAPESMAANTFPVYAVIATGELLGALGADRDDTTPLGAARILYFVNPMWTLHRSRSHDEQWDYMGMAWSLGDRAYNNKPILTSETALLATTGHANMQGFINLSLFRVGQPVFQITVVTQHEDILYGRSIYNWDGDPNVTRLEPDVREIATAEDLWRYANMRCAQHLAMPESDLPFDVTMTVFK
jgi:hypothetical protein